jgi:membrane AbrB-like protein
MPVSHLARIALTLLLGALAATLGATVGAPLPWMIGPLVASAALGLAGLPLAASTRLRNAGQWAIGTALGLYFTPQVVGVVAAHWPSILAGVVWALALGAGFAAFLRRANPGNAALDRPTLFFAGAIGSASEMAVLAERHGGRVDLVASAHSVRLLIVVVGIPFGFQAAGLHGLDPSLPGPQVVNGAGLVLLACLTAAGGLAMNVVRVPNPWVIGALLVAFGLTANGIELSALPKWLTNAAQLCIGVALGTRFTPAFVRSAPRWLGSVAIGTLLLLLLSAAFALAVARLSGLHPATVLLATSPGGIAEMCITAKVLQLGVPVVTAFHVTRMAAVVLLAEPLFRRWAAERAR